MVGPIRRRRILLVSQLGTLLSWLIFLAALYVPVTTLAEVETAMNGSFTLTLPLVGLFVARAPDGLTGGNVSVANAYLADVTTESEVRDSGRWPSRRTSASCSATKLPWTLIEVGIFFSTMVLYGLLSERVFVVAAVITMVGAIVSLRVRLSDRAC